MTAKTRSVGAFRFRENRVFELLQALLPREATMLHESVAQEFKARFPLVHDAGLGRVQCQTIRGRPLTDQGQSLFCFCRRAAQDHEVVRVAHQLDPFRRHQMVQRVEIDVAQQRTVT